MAAAAIKANGLLSNTSPLEKMKIMNQPGMFDKMVDKRIKESEQIEKVVDKVKPDVILIDDMVGLPCLIYNGKQWVNIASTNPLFYIGGEKLPPPGSGMI